MARKPIEEQKVYRALPSLREFHTSNAVIRCIVGPVGSGKTTAAAWDMCYYVPNQLFRDHGIKRTRWCVVRNSYVELIDTTQATIFDWFPTGEHKVQRQVYLLHLPGGLEVEILFRSCDRPEDVRKFKSLELTGYWIDESIEVKEEIKRMLKNRIGRYPRLSPRKFGIETTNPPDVEHPTYSMFAWGSNPPPGPVPTGDPLPDHAGFWQPPHENIANLGPSYYDDLRAMYRDAPDWLAMYVEGKPGVTIKGKLVYHNFRRDVHVAKAPLQWKANEVLYRGWDNTGNSPAAVVLQQVQNGELQVLKEFTHDRMGIVDFTKWVVAECNTSYPGAEYVDYADPAGEAKYSRGDGGFTSSAELMREIGVNVRSSDNNWEARREVVETQLKLRDGLLIDPGCTRLINGFLAGYCYPEIGNTSVYRDKPAKNRFSHVHDALQYVVLKLMRSSDSVSMMDAARTVRQRYIENRDAAFL